MTKLIEKNLTKATCCKYFAQMLQTHSNFHFFIFDLIERWTRFDNFNKFASNFRCHIQYIRYISSCLRIFGKFFFLISNSVWVWGIFMERINSDNPTKKLWVAMAKLWSMWIQKEFFLWKALKGWYSNWFLLPS